MKDELVFSVVEIKALGSGIARRLSVRMDGKYDGAACGGEPPAVFTIHAVLPYSPKFGTLQIGQRFILTPAPDQLANAAPPRFGLR